MRFEVFKAFIHTDAWLPRATQLLHPACLRTEYTHILPGYMGLFLVLVLESSSNRRISASPQTTLPRNANRSEAFTPYARRKAARFTLLHRAAITRFVGGTAAAHYI